MVSLKTKCWIRSAYLHTPGSRRVADRGKVLRQAVLAANRVRSLVRGQRRVLDRGREQAAHRFRVGVFGPEVVLVDALEGLLDPEELVQGRGLPLVRELPREREERLAGQLLLRAVLPPPRARTTAPSIEQLCET